MNQISIVPRLFTAPELSTIFDHGLAQSKWIDVDVRFLKSKAGDELVPIGDNLYMIKHHLDIVPMKGAFTIYSDLNAALEMFG
jgi:hypothetical protein